MFGDMNQDFGGYIDLIKERSKKNRVVTKHQLVGLNVAEILSDRSHKALYMKLAKENNPDLLLAIAKGVAENGNIKNKGAYFMRVWKERHGNSNDKRRTKVGNIETKSPRSRPVKSGPKKSEGDSKGDAPNDEKVGRRRTVRKPSGA